jgi:hypothetical protein
MEELVRYDPHLVVGILGGGAGTTYDAFKLIGEAQKYGARVALFGRKINNAENQLAFIEFLRLIVEGVISPEEAVRAYHGTLDRLGVRPQRSLDDDMRLETNVMSYSGTGVSMPRSIGGPTPNVKPAAAHNCGCHAKPSKTSNSSTGAAAPAGKQGCSCHDAQPAPPAKSAPAGAASEPDFSKMTSSEKLAYNQAKRDRIFG